MYGRRKVTYMYMYMYVHAIYPVLKAGHPGPSQCAICVCIILVWCIGSGFLSSPPLRLT